jgi:hypothetical protein
MYGHDRLHVGISQERVRAKLPNFGGAIHKAGLRLPTSSAESCAFLTKRRREWAIYHNL